MTEPINWTGRKFGRLTVLSKMSTWKSGRHVTYLCQCECGEKVPVAATNLRNGHTRSCGCLLRESSIATGKKAQARKQAERDFLAEQRRKAQEDSL